VPAPAPYDRARYNRALIANALLDPFNVVLLAVVLIVGILLGIFVYALPLGAVLYLADKITPEVAAKSGFRPSTRETAPVAPITAANGADPKQPERVLALPEPRVLAAIRKAWRRDRKPANIMLVLDTSGSMNDEQRLERAKAGLDVFFKNVEPQDAVGLTIFSDTIQPLVAPAPLSKSGDELRARVRGLIADGGTAFYDATT